MYKFWSHSWWSAKENKLISHSTREVLCNWFNIFAYSVCKSRRVLFLKAHISFSSKKATGDKEGDDTKLTCPPWPFLPLVNPGCWQEHSRFGSSLPIRKQGWCVRKLALKGSPCSASLILNPQLTLCYPKGNSMVAENQVTDTCNTSPRTNKSKMSWFCLHQPQPLVSSNSDHLHKKYVFQCLSSQIYPFISTYMYITTFPSIQSSVTKHFICSVC